MLAAALPWHSFRHSALPLSLYFAYERPASLMHGIFPNHLASLAREQLRALSMKSF